ncbi:hypothetical protein CK203_011269 [Vitis vinifera]|uniref:Reverse transcriptase zinc-binding domain-containing protein n=1 Tax=Vitis vinifera TaxID=29760 RepID=A0A438JYZ1_VITVI|nr:hypothetical protein CK203_011269 [Vitis vinifera]
MGNGKKVNFWKNKWCGTTPLSSRERAGSWSPCFSRPFNDWELDEVKRLLCCLGGKKMNLDEEDRVKWMDLKDGNFSPKISFFAWEASWRKVLTLDRIQKRGWALADRCVLGVSLFGKGNPLRVEGVFCG